MEYDSAIKEEWHNAICRNVDGLGGHMLCEINQTEKDKYYMVPLYVKCKKHD